MPQIKIIASVFQVLLSLTVFVERTVSVGRYQPQWASLDSRPLPDWYDQGKFGVFIHWGVFSVPAFGSEWFWEQWQGRHKPQFVDFMRKNYPPDFTYADFAPQFKAEFFNPSKWAKVLKKSGARYVVMVGKHHEGFTNWPSKYSWNWNAGDVGPKRDLVGELAQAVRNETDVRFGLYHSMFEWFHPLYLQDKANNFSTQHFVQQKTLPELYELVKRYKPDVVWSDGDWEAPDTYWNSKEFLAWLYNDSPVKDSVVVNDRWGQNTHCRHGGFWNCKDHFQPGKLIPHKWENCMKIDYKSWGYRADASIHEFLDIDRLIGQLVATVSLGGNLLLNIGPMSRGSIPPVYEERLLQVGSWLKVNGPAIYGTHIWSHQNDSLTPNVWYTAKKDKSENIVYAILLNWPTKWYIELASPIVSDDTVIKLVGFHGDRRLDYLPMPGGGVRILLPAIAASEMPCQWAWSLEMTHLKNHKTNLDFASWSSSVKAIKMHEN